MCLKANISHFSFDQSGRSGRIELQLWAYLFFLLKITYYDIYESCSSSKLSGHAFYNKFFGVPIFTDTVPQISLEYLELSMPEPSKINVWINQIQYF